MFTILAEGANPFTQLTAQFGVTWPLFIAQVVNFLFVPFVLKKFAFGLSKYARAAQKQNF